MHILSDRSGRAGLQNLSLRMPASSRWNFFTASVQINDVEKHSTKGKNALDAGSGSCDPTGDSIPASKRSRFVASCCLWTLAAILLLGAGVWRVHAQVELARIKNKFTIARIRYSVPLLGWGAIGDPQGPPWSHDWPRSEEHLMKIMAEVTKLDVNPGGHVTSFDSDDVFSYPIAYLCEVGYLDLSEQEAHNMSEYLLRGGFLIVDDFRGENALDNFRQQMKRVFPERCLEELPRAHPIWNCFYDISSLLPDPPYAKNLVPQYFGISDDRGRLMMVVDYNTDISEYWEWSDNPLMPIKETNEAYKYGVNYLMYALTH